LKAGLKQRSLVVGNLLDDLLRERKVINEGIVLPRLCSTHPATCLAAAETHHN